jgi:hypothetical protein
VDAVLAAVLREAKRLPENWQQAAANLCDDARRVGEVGHAEMVRRAVRESVVRLCGGAADRS